MKELEMRNGEVVGTDELVEAPEGFVFDDFQRADGEECYYCTDTAEYIAITGETGIPVCAQCDRKHAIHAQDTVEEADAE